MVPDKTHRRKTLIVCILTFIIAFGFGMAVAFFVNRSTPEPEPDTLTNDEPVEPEEPEVIVREIDFQPLINQWANSVGGSKGVIIYDLDLKKVVGAINADTKFQTASLYKLFVVYQGYRLVQNGEWDGSTKAGATGKTIMECLDKAIRESHSPCAETLWGMLGRDSLDAVVQNDFGLANFYVGSLSATPREIMQMMQIYHDHSEIVDETLVSRMKESFLNQPITTYNWRQGLPSGFSNDVLVYNKVGWNWNGNMWTIYDDAAIVDFVNYDRHYIVVVMTSGIAFQKIRDFGTQIEDLVNAEYPDITVEKELGKS